MMIMMMIGLEKNEKTDLIMIEYANTLYDVSNTLFK